VRHLSALALAVALASGGCVFDTGALSPGDGPVPDARADVAVDRGAGDVPPDTAPPDAPDAAAPDAGPGEDAGPQEDGSADAADAAGPDAVVEPFCDRGNPDLVACYRFEGNVEDGSGYSNHGTATGVTFATGIAGQAVGTVPGSDIAVPESVSLDCATALTIEAWVWPQELPASGRAGVIDNDGQYGLFIHPGGDLYCTTTQSWLVAAAAVAAGQWQHLACVYDGSALRLYRDGVELAWQAQTGGIPTGSSNGVRIGENNPPGDHFTGLIDGLRVWCVARGAADLCTQAGDCG